MMASGAGSVRKHGVRRRMVLDHAARLFVERGYAGTSIEEIGRTAGVTGPAVYRHFPSKLALLVSLVDEGCRRLLEATDRAGTDQGLTPREALADLLAAYVGFLVEHRHLAIVAENSMSALEDSDRDRVMEISKRFRGRVVAALRRDRPALTDDQAWFAVNSVVGMCRTAIRSRNPLPEDALRRRLLAQAMAVLLLEWTETPDARG